MSLRAALARWSRPVAMSVLDQALASGAHFGLSLLAARGLAPADYGTFALTYAIFLFAAGLHNAIILEPMGVIGPGRYGGRLESYLGTVLWLHAGLTLAIAALFTLGAAVLAAAGNGIWPAVLAMGGAEPAILLFWLSRRACYLPARPDIAVAGSFGYAALLAMGLVWLWRTDRVSASGIFLLMAGAGAAVSLGLWARLGVRLEDIAGRTARRSLSAVIAQHWGYARWSLGTTVLYWLASSVYLPLVGAVAGLRAVAVYRATDNLLLPMSQVLTAVGMLLLPWLSRQHSLHGRAYVKGAAVKVAAVAASAAALYTACILVSGGSLVRLIYASDYYVSCLTLVPYLGAAVVLRAVSDTGLGIAARSAARPDLGFWATAAAAGVTLTLGLAMVSRYGAVGAAVGWMTSSAASCLAYVFLFRSRIR